MTHAVAVLQLGITAAAARAAIFGVDPAAPAAPAAAGATDTVAVATVVVSAAATGGIHARRHLHVSRRATAPWRRPGRPL